MRGSEAMKIGTTNPDNLIAGDFHRVTDWLSIPGGTPRRGTVLKADGTAMATTEAPFAVLAEDADASGGAVQAPVYLTGEFTAAHLKLAGDSSVSDPADIAALRALSIFAKQSVASAV